MVGAQKNTSEHYSRLRLLVGLFVFAFFIIIVRLFSLQVVSGAYWKQVASMQHGGQFALLPIRGEILAQDKKTGSAITMATTAKKPLAFAVPALMEDINQEAEKASAALGLTKEEVLTKIADKQKRYVVLKKNLTEEEALKVKDIKSNNIRVEDETARFYPNGDTLAAVMGFVGYKGDSSERVGLYGLERNFEDTLKGRVGSLAQERAGKTSAWIFGGKRDFSPSEDGQNLLLTVDVPTQRKVEQVVADTLKKHEAERGCAIVMDAQNGQIIALASLPGFDPNNYGQTTDLSVYNNVCLSNYEPGSVFKPITMAASLEEGKLSPDTTYTDTGKVEVGGFTIKNSDNKAHGLQTMTQVLEKSLNTGAIFSKNAIGNASFKKWVYKFGFGEKTGVELPEASGNLKNLEEGGDTHYATASFGQGISTTPLQVAASFASIANGGRRVAPRIVQSKILSNGKRIDTETSERDTILSKSTTMKLTGMLVNVVENGHGKKAGVQGYSVAGKTGTAQVVLPGGKGYDPHKTIGTFVGYAPAYDAKYVVLVRIDKPSTVQFAESTAAPAFGEIMRFVLDRFNIPPDRLTKN